MVLTAWDAAFTVARIDIACSADAQGGTRAQVTYTFTGLSEAGNAYVETFTEPHYAEWLRAWQGAIDHYLRHGAAAPHHHA